MSDTAVPTWAWVTLGALAVGGLVGGAIYVARRPRYDWLLLRAGVPAELLPFAAVQRHTESRGNAHAGLGRPELFPWFAEPRHAKPEEQENEHQAAVTAYERNREYYDESPFPRPMWVFGSGGPYGLIPGNALGPFRDTKTLRNGKVSPWDVFNPWRSTVMFADYVWRLLSRDEFRELPDEAKNWLAIKRGLASPALMADYAETHERSRSVRRRAEEAAEALGLDPGFLRERVPTKWPDYRGAVELLG